MWRLPHATASSPFMVWLTARCLASYVAPAARHGVVARAGSPAAALALRLADDGARRPAKRLEGGGAGLYVMPQGTKACMPPPPFPGPLVSGNRTGYTVDPCIDGRRRMMKCGRHNDINVIGYMAESGTRAAVRGNDGRLPPLRPLHSSCSVAHAGRTRPPRGTY